MLVSVFIATRCSPAPSPLHLLNYTPPAHRERDGGPPGPGNSIYGHHHHHHHQLPDTIRGEFRKLKFNE